MTEFGFKVVPEASINPVVGGCVLVCHADGRYELTKHYYKPAPAPMWSPR